jgi:hypothetical protein
MAEPTREKPGPRTAKPRSPLARTVLKVTAVAIVAVALLWSALFVDLLRKRSDAAAGSPSAPTGQVAGPDRGQPAPASEPLTTRTS